ncbi:MAG: hypothetical protein WC868_05170 [Bacteroidales bacterium]
MEIFEITSRQSGTERGNLFPDRSNQNVVKISLRKYRRRIQKAEASSSKQDCHCLLPLPSAYYIQMGE